MCNDSSRQGGNEKGVPQIEVTPEMIEAGVKIYTDWWEGRAILPAPTEAAFVEHLFRHMAAIQQRGSQRSP